MKIFYHVEFTIWVPCLTFVLRHIWFYKYSAKILIKMIWRPSATLFCIFTFFTIQTFIHNIRWVSSLYLHSWSLSGLNPHGVPSRGSNSDLPYSKQAHYHLSYAAPYLWATLQRVQRSSEDFNKENIGTYTPHHFFKLVQTHKGESIDDVSLFYFKNNNRNFTPCYTTFSLCDS